MAWTSSRLKTRSGADLNLYSGMPKDDVKGVVHINHGMAEHAGRYERFALALNEAGYAAYAQDHRGHGSTKAPNASRGIFAAKNGWDAVMDDVADVNTHIAAQHPGTPIICFGHSMGCIIAFNHILREPQSIAGAALWNSGVETGALAAVFLRVLKIQRFFKGSDVPSGLAQKATFETWNKQFAPNRTDFDWLSRVDAEVDAYIADPMCGFDVSIGLWLDVLEGIYFAASNPILAELPKDMPIHLQAGTQDPCTENGKAMQNIENRMKKQGMSNVTFNLIEDARHESLNEIGFEQTTTEFVAWLDELTA